MDKIIKECPKCGKNSFHYDAFEDMYRCNVCEVFYYPEEIGAKTNRNAPIFNMGSSPTAGTNKE